MSGLEALTQLARDLGDRVVSSRDGRRWRRHHLALLPLTAMPNHGALPWLEAQALLLRGGAVLARNTVADREDGSWWNVVCRAHDFGALSANTRSQVRRGRKRHTLRRLSEEEWLALGHACHVAAHERYRDAEPLTAAGWEAWARAVARSTATEVFGALDGDGRLAGYIACVEEPLGVFMHTIDITPVGLKNYASAALIEHVTEHYVSRGIPVCNGARSVLHDTNMQDYLLRLGFQREHAQLQLVYLFPLGLGVALLRRFPALLERLPEGGASASLRALMAQDALVDRDRGAVYRDVFKPLLDRSVAAAGLVAAAAPMAMIAAAIRLTDGPPAVFRQTRVGQHGRPFVLYKFRTMSTGRGGGTVTVRGDVRVTPLGAVLRRFKLDELPQLFNVLRGDMSLVGPRPDVPGYADALTGADRAVLDLKPGITGPATLAYRREEEILAAQPDPVHYNDTVVYPHKVELNLEYLAKANPILDARCLLETVAPGLLRRLRVPPVVETVGPGRSDAA
ncbi:MAG: sugar transferase [Myxococcota bacterium]|nr:sugar transferase [Myxococcota bacterium]